MSDDELTKLAEQSERARIMSPKSTCCDGAGCLNCGDSGLLIDQPIATLVLDTDGHAHDGAGWYYYDEEYQDEGSVGAFATREEAEAHARAAGYQFDDARVVGRIPA